MKIAIGSDHGGYLLKEEIKKYFDKEHIKYNDFGTNSLDSVDYPDYAKKVSNEVVKQNFDFGILICGTGIGISIAANKIKGVRAALVYDEITAKLAKQHNNANIITLGGRTTTAEKAISIINSYMNETFEQRHQQRLDKISKLESENEDA